MKTTLGTPAAIGCLIHYHCFPEPHPRKDSPVVRAETQRFLRLGLIEREHREDHGDYCTTKLGAAWMKALTEAPMPGSYPDEGQKILRDLSTWTLETVTDKDRLTALRSLAHRAKGFLGLQDSPAPAGQTGIAEAIGDRWYHHDIFIQPEIIRHVLQKATGGASLFFFKQPGFKSHPTPEAAIREQLAAGVKVWSGDKEVVEDQPGLPLVPLGLNYTESGRKVEVIRNDLKEGHPVVARIYREDGTYFLAEYLATGMPHGGLEANMRLVGHLPPEPPKPREVWADLDDRGCFLGTQTTPKDGYVHFREVLPAAGKQYHVWVRDSDGDVVRGSEQASREDGYRKAILIEVTTP